MENEPFYENFYYPKAKPLGKSQLLKRRFKQLKQILFSKRYNSPADLFEGVSTHYSQDPEVQFYKAYSQYGLHENEQEALHEFIQTQKNKTRLSSLVVGCGAGREAFSLAKLEIFSTIFGIDISEEMVLAAKDQNTFSHVDFSQNEAHEVAGTFDLIWVTSILESHIQGRKHRVAFFKNLKEHLKQTGGIVLTPFVRPLHWKSPYFWSSQALKLRWIKNKTWEPGDVLVSNLGAHNQNEKLVYSHFYPSKYHFTSELYEAGFTNILELSQESWLIQI